ncbi:flagellar biosynthesis protein FlgE [Buchnera aphidicola (Diuraphis noxia)]|uniref:Flagellar hook protein FlgE n=1 Tax=Buchnera aphidicola subsp. Diuraphis noxia TaxID=118101 RepID=A0A1B2H8X2_BUCDN|nr:flagellar hook protein FlgE [Buchnera aphidicola]ANZ22546.1 flagellar biosynthesis protein FlgE [Buchnera aphidicola (Diuraphis noxia)]
MSNTAAMNGLLVNSYYIDIISNNVANASTIGYKSSTPIFFDIYSNANYLTNNQGSGVGISDVMQNFNNGVFIETGRDLDLAIIEQGFFRLLDPKGYVRYTKNGQFLLDNDNNIVNTEGMYLTGINKFISNDNVNTISGIEPINIKHADILDGRKTSEIKMHGILNMNASPIPNNANQFFNRSSSKDYIIDIYDKNQQKQQLNIIFSKIDEKKWKVNIESGTDVIKEDIKDTNNHFEIEFDSNGEIISSKKITINPKILKGDSITLDLTDITAKPNVESGLEKPDQDGYPIGFLKVFNILSNGEIIGTYSNEKTQSIGQILLSNFKNPEKLQRESGSTWSVTSESGSEKIGVAGNIGFGMINKKILEGSNVDLNKELLNMIIAQRNYQSNAQSFKAEDRLVSTLINLK